MADLGASLRSPLAKTLYSKMLEDQSEQCRDYSTWYSVCTDQLTEDLRESFLQLDKDQETTMFLDRCYTKSDWIFTQLYQTLLKSLLSWVMTSTSINGLLGRGSMFVFSKSQFRSLLGIDPEWLGENLIDLGAGDGAVTERMASYFKHVYVTEMSRPMVWKLREKQYQIISVDEWHDGSRTYDVISCLNVLDRCEKPASMLRHIRQSLTPSTGRAIIATVIPFKPYVEFGNDDNMPEQYLRVEGNTFEKQVASLITDIFLPAGLIVETFTRVPYLCEGDMSHSYYVLDDAVFVLKPA